MLLYTDINQISTILRFYCTERVDLKKLSCHMSWNHIKQRRKRGSLIQKLMRRLYAPGSSCELNSCWIDLVHSLVTNQCIFSGMLLFWKKRVCLMTVDWTVNSLMKHSMLRWITIKLPDDVEHTAYSSNYYRSGITLLKIKPMKINRKLGCHT